MKEISLEYLLTKIEYNKESGVFRKKGTNQRGIIVASKPTGSRDKNGYVVIKIKDIRYFAHRLVWFIENRSWPTMIDHINGVPFDNRIENLKASNSRENQANQRKHRLGRLLGCYFNKTSRKWCAQITIKGRKLRIGCFTTELAAHNAYINKRLELAK